MDEKCYNSFGGTLPIFRPDNEELRAKLIGKLKKELLQTVLRTDYEILSATYDFPIYINSSTGCFAFSQRRLGDGEWVAMGVPKTVGCSTTGDYLMCVRDISDVGSSFMKYKVEGDCVQPSGFSVISRSKQYRHKTEGKENEYCLTTFRVSDLPPAEYEKKCNQRPNCLIKEVDDICQKKGAGHIISVSDLGEVAFFSTIMFGEGPVEEENVLLGVIRHSKEIRLVEGANVTLLSKYAKDVKKCLYIRKRRKEIKIVEDECNQQHFIVCRKKAESRKILLDRLKKINETYNQIKLSERKYAVIGFCKRRDLPFGFEYTREPFLVSINGKEGYYCIFDIEIKDTAEISTLFSSLNGPDVVCNLLFDGHLLSVADDGERECLERYLFPKNVMEFESVKRKKKLKRETTYRLLGAMITDNVLKATFSDHTSATFATYAALSANYAYDAEKLCIALFDNDEILRVSCDNHWSYLTCKVRAKTGRSIWNATKVEPTKLTKPQVQDLVDEVNRLWELGKRTSLEAQANISEISYMINLFSGIAAMTVFSGIAFIFLKKSSKFEKELLEKGKYNKGHSKVITTN